MDLNAIFNQILGATQQASRTVGRGNGLSDIVGKMGGGTALAGLAAVLLGRGGGARALQTGSLAALGALAYQAYQAYQRNAKNQMPVAGANNNFSMLQEQQFAPQANSGQALLRTMVAAAAADGVLDEQEKQIILQEVGQSQELLQWVQNELNHPATPAQLAAEVVNQPGLATQVYLAARMVCGELNRKEIVFLDQLAQALGLDQALVESIEREAGF